MERTVSEVLRKMVRKYSSKRPEVIVTAVENASSVLAGELKTRLSRKSHGVFGLSAGNQSSYIHTREGTSRKLNEFTDEEDVKGDSFDVKQPMPEEDSKTKPDLEVSSSHTFSKSKKNWESFEAPSPVILSKVNSGFISEEHKYGKLRSEEPVNSPDPPPMAMKPAKKTKWKPEEITKLIEKRGELDSRFQVVKGRMVLWEEISASMLNHGINWSPARCKSLWAKLVQKYEESRTDEESRKSWPYFAAVEKILSAHEVSTK